MTRVAVDLHQLADLVDRLDRFHAQLCRAHDDVDGRVRELHATWSGAAAHAQVAAHAQWRSGAREVQEALAVLRLIASTAHGNYGAAVAANQLMWIGC